MNCSVSDGVFALFSCVIAASPIVVEIGSGGIFHQKVMPCHVDGYYIMQNGDLATDACRLRSICRIQKVSCA